MSPQFWQALLAAEMPPAKSRALLEELGSSSGDPLRWLLEHRGLSDTERRRISALSDEGFQKAIAGGVSVLEPGDYPETLAEAEGAPPAVFVWGDASALRRPLVGIVGTRSASTYGKACAQKFAEALARAGATVVSGGALGIDAAAHKGALAAEGRTVAVLAGGVDHVYPAVHDRLFQDIRLRGCLISQFAVGARPNEYKFLVRNHLIAALSQALVVIEAPTKSGAITTAVAAAEYGREVFVVPAGIEAITFKGSFNLIRDGATLVDHPDQVIEALGLRPELQMSQPDMASATARIILSTLTTSPLATEFIVEKTGLTTADVLAELTMLELDGRVIRDGNGYALRP